MRVIQESIVLGSQRSEEEEVIVRNSFSEAVTISVGKGSINQV